MMLNLKRCGDREIDSVREAVAQTPTDMTSFPYHVAIMTSWINLLHRQGANLEKFAPIFDRLKASAAQGDDELLCKTIDAAFEFLNNIQSNLTLPATNEESQSSSSSTETNTATDWPVYGGNMHLTSSTADEGPSQGTLAWKQAIGLAWYARPAIGNGRAYIPSPGIRTMLHCVDLETGETIWQTRRTWNRDSLGIVNLVPSSYVLPGIASTPILTQDSVVVNQLGAQGRNLGNKHVLIIDRETGDIKRRIPAGEADYRIGYAPLAGNSDYLVYPTGTQRAQERPPQLIGQNRIVCQHIDDKSGKYLWDFHIGPTFCEPTVDDNLVFTANADGMVLCLRIDGASGADHFGFSDDRRVAWQFNAGAGVNNKLAVTEDHVYFGANNGVIYCLDKQTGTLRWQTQAKTEAHSFKLFSKPFIENDRVYIGSAAHEFLCLNADTGEVAWSFETDDWIRAEPYLVGDQVVVATLQGTLYCLTKDGKLVWKNQIGTHPIYADLVGQGNHVLITASDLRVFCVDVTTGDTLWTVYLLDQAFWEGRQYQADELACGGWLQSKPTAADGRVYIGTPSRFVMAFDHATGEELWRYEVGGAVSAAPAIANGRVYFGQKGEEFFYCLDAKSGDLIWKQAVGWVWSSANVADGRVFVPGSDGYVACLDAETGYIRWRYRTGSSTAPEPPIDGDMVFFGSWDHYVYALHTETGKLMWQFHTGGSPDSGAPIAYQNKVYVPVGGNRLFCLDRTTGGILWTHRVTDGDLNASPALANGKLYISMGVRPGAVPIASLIQCLDAEDGQVIWSHEGGGITGPSVANDKVYFASTSSPYFYCVDAADGTLLWKYEMVERVYESVPAIYGNRAYILNENGYLFAFN